MAIVESLAVGLGLHLGKKVIDWIWEAIQRGEAPIAGHSGKLGFTASRAGRTMVGKEFTVPRAQANELIVGSLYLPYTIMGFLTGDEIPLMLIVEETQQQVLLFRANLDVGYEIYLPHGIYSFYVFLMDPSPDDFLDAEIYAVGLPSQVDLSDIDRFSLEDPEDIWSIVTDFPIEITRGGPYALNLILIDTDEIPEFPKFFSELFGDGLDAEVAGQPYDLTGTWVLREEYEFGSTMADVHLLEIENELHGVMIIRDVMADGTELIIEESFSGVVQGTNVSLSGTSVRAIKGRLHDYQLDQWVGVIENSNTIVGYSEDLAGTTGEFVMERM